MMGGDSGFLEIKGRELEGSAILVDRSYQVVRCPIWNFSLDLQSDLYLRARLFREMLNDFVSHV